jgi:pimeloyl-ACP methyl ester carboxylesterase
VEYDEFGLLEENAAEAGLAWRGRPPVRRESVDIGGGRRVSAVVWGATAPGGAELVLLHGGGQNAHTWDSVALALDRPLVAVDLPGHGHSDWRDDHDYRPEALAADLATALAGLAPSARLVVGMSLGGLAALCLAQAHPELVPRLALVDITPGLDRARAEPILAFLDGPPRFDSFQEILDRTIAFSPGRSPSARHRGVLHNTRQLPDGSWSWRWDPGAASRADAAGSEALWPLVDAISVPVLLLRGSRSRVASDADAAEFLRRQPLAQVEVVPGAGHSIQGDRPVDLAGRLARFLDERSGGPA